MEVFEAVRTILAVREYQDKPMPPETVRRIVEAGWLTGSSMNRQPWHFIVVQDRDTLRQLGALATTGPYIAQASLAIVMAIQRTPFSVSDGSRAIQSMMLTAWSEGVGSNWVGFMGMTDVKPLLGIPDDLDILAIIPFGYPGRPVGKGKKKRKPLSEVARLKRFGQPFQ
ncbi:MAG TPA: nitroreductase family protein [Candidatus Binatia bacterium]|jgi:nitroreductase